VSGSSRTTAENFPDRPNPDFVNGTDLQNLGGQFNWMKNSHSTSRIPSSSKRRVPRPPVVPNGAPRRSERKSAKSTTRFPRTKLPPAKGSGERRKHIHAFGYERLDNTIGTPERRPSGRFARLCSPLEYTTCQLEENYKRRRPQRLHLTRARFRNKTILIQTLGNFSQHRIPTKTSEKKLQVNSRVRLE
jgi:hypothetical protein